MIAAKRMQKQIKAPFKYILRFVFWAYLTEEEMEKVSTLDEGMTLFGSNENPQYAKMLNSVKLHQE